MSASHPFPPSGAEMRRAAHRRRGWTVPALLVALMAMTAVQGLPSEASARTAAATKPVTTSGIAHWRSAGHYLENSVTAGEGVATVTRPGHGSHELYRGLLSVPKKLAAEGWSHIGDPDSAGGYVIDAYQGPSSRPSKMFLVTKPSGGTVQYIHKLVAHELYNNSFDAIAPGSQWMVAGEWETMTHLQVYRTPLLNHQTSSRGGTLRLVGYIRLDHKVNDIQGCDFVTKTSLICASDDDSEKIFTNEKPLLEVDLRHALSDGSVRGHVVDLGSIPQVSTCSGTFEAEGVDFDVATGTLRVEVIQPGSCIIKTTVYKYVRKH